MVDCIKFMGPVGNEIVNPDVEWLVQLLKSGDEYWLEGSQDAGVRYVKGREIFAEIILMARDGLGVFVQHTYGSDKVDHVAVSPSAGPGDVTIQHAGNPWDLPKAFFVSRDEAIIALRQFLKDGRRSDRIQWTEF